MRTLLYVSATPGQTEPTRYGQRLASIHAALLLVSAMCASGCGPTSTGIPVSRISHAPKPLTNRGRIQQLLGLTERALEQRLRALQQRIGRAYTKAPSTAPLLLEAAELMQALQRKSLKAAEAKAGPIARAMMQGNEKLQARLQRDQVALQTRAAAWRARAVVVLRRIVGTQIFRSYRRLDDALITLARFTGELAASVSKKSRKKALHRRMLALYSRLLRDLPTSKHVPEALLGVAEHHYQMKHFATAVAVYDKLIRHGRSRWLAYAHYKLGWCLYRLGKKRLALRALITAARSRHADKILKHLALRKTLRIFTAVGAPEKAYSFLLGLCRGNAGSARDLFLLLGEIYQEQGRHRLCIRTYRTALKLWPKDRARCSWATHILNARINLGVKAAVVKEFKVVARVLRVLTRQLGAKADQVTRCRRRTERDVKMLATQWHVEGMKTRNRQTLKLATHLYRVAIRMLPESKDLYLMMYQHADLLWYLHKKIKTDTRARDWRKLARLFTSIVKLRQPKGMKRKEYISKRNSAALGAVRCLMRAVKSTDKTLFTSTTLAKPVRKCVQRRRRRCLRWTTVYPKQKIPAADQRLLEAIKIYMKLVPRSRFRPPIVFNAGHIYWNYNHFDRATKLFLRVALEYSQQVPRAARTAALRVLGMAKVRKRDRDWRVYLDKFIASRGMMQDAAFAAKIHDLKLKSLLGIAEGHRRKRRFAQCGAAFEEMATRYYEHSKVDEFYWSASLCYEAAGMLGPAIGMRRYLVRRPRSFWARLALFYNATAFRKLGFIKTAAKKYEALATRYPNSGNSPDALRWAVVLLRGLGRSARLTKLSALFITRYRKQLPRQTAEVFWTVVRHYEEQGDPKKYVLNLKRYVRSYAGKGRADRHFEALVRLARHEWTRSCPEAMTNGLCLAKPAPVRRRGSRPIVRRAFRTRKWLARASARRLFKKAWRLWHGGRLLDKIPKTSPERHARQREAVRYAAYTAFMLAETEFEAFVKARPPKWMRVAPRDQRRIKQLVKRLNAWSARRRTAGAVVQRRFLTPLAALEKRARPLGRPDAPWAIASMVRTAQIHLSLADALASRLTTHSPELTSASLTKKLQRHVSTLRATAASYYRRGFTLSIKLRTRNDWSRLCERALHRLTPKRFRRSRELLPKPGYTDFRLRPADFRSKEQDSR